MELTQIRQELMACLNETLPTKEFSAAIITATVWLHVIEARVRKTQNIHERRRLTDEFNNRKKTIEKGLRLLRKSSGKDDNASKEEGKRAVP
jgi:hypothetical protein